MDIDNEKLYKNQKIIEVDMKDEVKQSFIEYAMSVITARALPDVRDGMKPVHRRILYAMYEDRLTYDRPFRKSATTVGNVLGRYHPHGDTAVYDSMVRMAQSFNMRYPLIEGHGNFGNIDGDDPAAYRYTEARLSRLANEMTRDIDKDTVDFTINYDNKLKEPTVLPSRFPALLVNGVMGIAVGMATNIPTHNLGEIIDGVIMTMDNPAVTVSDLMTVIKGPDFPTGGIICGTAGIYEAYMTGRGRITVRSRAEVEEDKHRIIVTEIPYRINKTTMVEGIANCVKDKRIEGITALRDESGRDGLRVVIEYRRDVNGHIILNQLYKYTLLQATFAANMVVLVDGEPKLLGLKELISHYIAHQEDVISRRVRFELTKAENEAHINEGYKVAIDNIDEVIAIIRGSESIPDAKARLMERFELSDVQAQAIVDMTLGRLSGLERQKVEERLARLYELIRELREILGDEGKIKEIIKEELLEIKRKFNDERRTELQPVENEIILEDLIERHRCLITMTGDGYIKRLPADTYQSQRRGGKGVIGMTTKEEDNVTCVLSADSHAYVLLFTNLGRVYVRKAYRIPEASRTARGTNLANLLRLGDGERVTNLLTVGRMSEGYLTMITRRGSVKRTLLSEFKYRARNGKIAITLRDDDELAFAAATDGESRLVIATRGGMALRCDENDIRPTGRGSQGVIGINLAEDDEVVGLAVTKEGGGELILTVTEWGYGKRCEPSDFTLQRRGGKGVRCSRVDATGPLCGVASVAEEDDIMLMTDDGTVMRTAVDEISIYNRTAGGVIIMRPAEGSVIAGFAKIPAVVPEGEEDDDEGDDGEDAGTGGDGCGIDREITGISEDYEDDEDDEPMSSGRAVEGVDIDEI